ncbi:MAG: multiheme c-type cytochrome [Pirellulales bacterium]
MSKKKTRTEHKHVATKPAGDRWQLLLMIGSSLAVAVMLVVAVWWSAMTADTGGEPFDLSQASFVGSQSCIQCHAKEAALYRGSHHDQAMAPATDKTVLADFGDVTLEHLGVTSRMFKQDGKFIVNTEGPDGALHDYQVKYVFGVEPLQQYLVELNSSGVAPSAGAVPRMQVLRLSWDTLQKRWFHLDPPDVRERLAPQDDLHWTGMGQRWNSMCAECHTTNYEKGFDTATLAYHSTFTQGNVNCEACHGPGSVHIDLAKKTFPGWNRTRGFGLANLKRSAEDQIQACAPCHSRRDVVAAGFRAGDHFYDFYSNQLLTEPVYYADGQILDEDFDHGSFIQSKMYHKGIRCTDCHDPHTSRLKHDGNAVCTSCHQHPTAKYDSPAHHFHKPGTAGAQCVNCHMPATVYMDVDARRDHSLPRPRPDLSLKIGTPNACTGCHLKPENVAADKRGPLVRYQDWMTAARSGDQQVKDELARADRWCDEACDKWYGELRRRDEHFGLALAAGQTRAENAEALLTRLIRKSGPEAPAIARATALQLLGSVNPRAAGEAAVAAVEDEHPLVRAAACEAALGNSNMTKTAGLLTKALKDSRRIVRHQAARSLLQIPNRYWPQGASVSVQSVMREIESGLLASNDRAGAHLSLGTFAEMDGREDDAIKHYRNAVRVEPGTAGARSNLATLLERRLDSSGRSADRSSSSDALREEIAKLRKEELALLERDAKLLPSAAPLQYRYGLALVLDKRLEEAAVPLMKAAELEPDNFEFVQAAAMLCRELKRYKDAAAWADKLKRLAPDDPVTQQLVEEIHREAAAHP